MKITRTPLVLTSSTYSREHGIPRSEGCHAMVVIERILRASGEKKAYDDWDETALENVRTPGFIWERVMSEHARQVVGDAGLQFPGEMFYCVRCDDVMAGGNIGQGHALVPGHKGIYFTPDAVMQHPYRYGVKEFKWTWKSSRRTGVDHLDGMKAWVMQVMWYAYMLGTLYGEIDAMFCRGDYSSGRPDVEPYTFQLEFTEKEQRRLHTMIVSVARSEGMV